MSLIKRKIQDGLETINPLILIGFFASITILVVGFIIVQTIGLVQVLLTGFIMIFPILIASALFYLLLIGNYVNSTSTDPNNEANTESLTKKVKKQRIKAKGTKKIEYDPSVHALMGMLEAVRLNSPSLNQCHSENNPILPIQTDFGAFPPARDINYKVRKVTTGSITREKAAKRFHFLLKDCENDSVINAIQQLVSNNKTFHVWIGQDGSTEESSETEEIEETIQLSITRDSQGKTKQTEYIYVQIIHALHDQLIVVYFQGELLGFSGALTMRFVKGMEAIKAPYKYSALVISDQGDIYGTMEELIQRTERI